MSACIYGGAKRTKEREREREIEKKQEEREEASPYQDKVV